MATIPKHKGTEKMRAELRRRMAKLHAEKDSKRGAAKVPRRAPAGGLVPHEEFLLQLPGQAFRALWRKAHNGDSRSRASPALDLFDPARPARPRRARPQAAGSAVADGLCCDPEDLPGAVGAHRCPTRLCRRLQKFGAYGANFNPHAHALVSDGVFLVEGEFLPLPALDAAAVMELFRRLLRRRLHQAERFSENFIQSLLTWVHPGFSVFAGPPVEAAALTSLESQARYITRPALAMDDLQKLDDGRLASETSPDPRTGATVVTLDPLEWIHRITAPTFPIPNEGGRIFNIQFFAKY